MIEYIVILVDQGHNHVVCETDTLKIQVFKKGSQMLGLQFKGSRPTRIIDRIHKRDLGLNVEFEDWWKHCVVPNSLMCHRGIEKAW